LGAKRRIHLSVQHAFDQVAANYDQYFTESVIGRHQRRALWRQLDQLFRPGVRVLDLGCGTGEDAIRLSEMGIEVHGIDISSEMIAVARLRAPEIEFDACSIENLHELPADRYDGAFSSFGPINCVRDLAPVASELANRVKPGGYVALCTMSRFCLWETLFYPLTLQLHKAIRRFAAHWTEAKVGESEFEVYYPSVRSLRVVFTPRFELVRAPGIGVFVPPSYLEPFAQRFPWLIRWLAKLDSLVEDLPLFRAVADHRLVIFRRASSGGGPAID